MASSLREKLRMFDADLPLEKARTIPRAWYCDPEIAAAEARWVFTDCWIVAGRVEQVADPGSFLTTAIAGEPIVIVRDQDGVLRAFFNVCRHRAALVLHQPHGKA